jgi:hypothetical protein
MVERMGFVGLWRIWDSVVRVDSVIRCSLSLCGNRILYDNITYPG